MGGLSDSSYSASRLRFYPKNQSNYWLYVNNTHICKIYATPDPTHTKTHTYTHTHSHRHTHIFSETVSGEGDIKEKDRDRRAAVRWVSRVLLLKIYPTIHREGHAVSVVMVMRMNSPYSHACAFNRFEIWLCDLEQIGRLMCGLFFTRLFLHVLHSSKAFQKCIQSLWFTHPLTHTLFRWVKKKKSASVCFQTL